MPQSFQSRGDPKPSLVGGQTPDRHANSCGLQLSRRIVRHLLLDVLPERLARDVGQLQMLRIGNVPQRPLRGPRNPRFYLFSILDRCAHVGRSVHQTGTASSPARIFFIRTYTDASFPYYYGWRLCSVPP